MPWPFLRWTALCRYQCALALALLLSSCFLFPEKKDGKKGSGASTGLIIREGIYFDRLGDGDTARLQFKTTRPAVCELSFYSREAGGTPTKEKPEVISCSGQDRARQEFTEQLTGLRADTLYDVVISAWELSNGKAKSESVLVRESSGNPNAVATGGKSELFKELFVARFDLPLRTAEVHRTVLESPIDVAGIKSRLTRKVGCQQGAPPPPAAFREAHKDLSLTNLATRDLASGTAQPHPNSPGRVQLTYGSLNDGVDKWTLLYQLNGKDVAVPIRPISRLINVEMESASVLSLDQGGLSSSPDTLKLDAKKPLKISWTTGSNLLELSYVAVQIGRPENDKLIYCLFPAVQRTASIDSKLLQTLEDGPHIVQVELASNQIWVKDGWLATLYDWRSAQIEK